MKGMAVGQSAALERRFAHDDVAAFRELLGSPEAAGAATGGTVPEALVGSLVSELLGTRLPGRGTNWLKQRFDFRRLPRIGERLTAEVAVVRLRPEKELVNLRTDCTGEQGPVCTGEALVLVRDVRGDRTDTEPGG